MIFVIPCAARHEMTRCWHGIYSGKAEPARKRSPGPAQQCFTPQRIRRRRKAPFLRLVDQNVSTFPSTLTIGANAGHPIDLNLGSLTGAARASQFSAASTNGGAAGSLTGVDIARNGRVTEAFSIRLRRDIEQIALVNFINAEGLVAGPGSVF